MEGDVREMRTAGRNLAVDRLGRTRPNRACLLETRRHTGKSGDSGRFAESGSKPPHRWILAVTESFFDKLAIHRPFDVSFTLVPCQYAGHQKADVSGVEL